MVFVEDPWSRIVAVHWKDDEEPPPGPDEFYFCGSFHWHVGQGDDVYLDLTLLDDLGNEYTTRYPAVYVAMPITLADTGMIIRTSSGLVYNVPGTDALSFDLDYSADNTVVVPRPAGSEPVWVWTQTLGWGHALQSSDPYHNPPPPAEPQYPFYSFHGSYPDDTAVAEATYPMTTNGAISLWLMGAGTTEFTPEYQAWVDYYYGGGGGSPPVTPPGGWHSNVLGYQNVDLTIKMYCNAHHGTM